MKRHPGPHACGPLVDPTRASPDAAFILEGDEFDWPWRLCRPHPTWYHEGRGRTIAWALPLMTTADDRVRMAAIRAWIRDEHGGDIDAALDSHPLIALADGQLLDGWHRLAVWMTHPGQRYPAAIVGEGLGPG